MPVVTIGTFAIGCVIAIIIMMLEGAAKNALKKEAEEKPPVRATVKKVTLTDKYGSANVIFETKDGMRLNLDVPYCTLVEGDTGLLRENSGVFSSFIKD